MKSLADRNTSKNTRDNSGRDGLGVSKGTHGKVYSSNKYYDQDKRYLRRDVADGRFGSPSSGRSVIRGKCERLSLQGFRLDIAEAAPTRQGKPDFTEADKDWIDKIDSTQLSWNDWD